MDDRPVGIAEEVGYLGQCTNEALLERYAYYSRLARLGANAVGRLEHEITKRMQADGATEMIAAGQIATLKTSVSYDQGSLRPIMELVPEKELVDKGAYAPEHEETVTRIVEAKWNLTKLKPFAKRGRGVQEVIDAAKIEGAPRLKIEEVKE